MHFLPFRLNSAPRARSADYRYLALEMRTATLIPSFPLGFRGTIRGGSFITWHKQRQALLLALVIASAIPLA
jgi:hypothetical protein